MVALLYDDNPDDYIYCSLNEEHYRIIKFVGIDRCIVLDEGQYGVVELGGEENPNEVICWLDQDLFLELMDLSPPAIEETIIENKERGNKFQKGAD